MAESIYTRASKIVEDRRKKNKESLALRKREVYERVPRIKEIEDTLDMYAIRMLNLLAKGDCEPEKAVSMIQAENKEAVEERTRLLVSNGFPEDYLDEKPTCPICNDTGFTGDKMCSCLKKEIASIALRDANMTKALTNQTFEKFSLHYYSDEYVEEYGCSPRENMQAILNECRAYAEKFPDVNTNLLFCGDCGLGKTFLSSAIANELIKKGIDVLYVSCNALFPILEDMHFGRQVNESSMYIVNKLQTCKLLILDDLGSEFVTQFTSAELFRIINNRLLNGGSMIISTNLNRNMLSKTYTERIASRITGSFSILEFLGSDIRKIKKLEKNGNDLYE